MDGASKGSIRTSKKSSEVKADDEASPIMKRLGAGADQLSVSGGRGGTDEQSQPNLT